MLRPDKLIINVGLTGMIPMKADNPNVPIRSDEIADDVLRCYNAGASIFHIHARDDAGRPTYRREVYQEIISQIRDRCGDDLILCVTTSGRVFNTIETRSEVLSLEDDLKPDMASLTLGSMNFPKQASINEPQMIQTLASAMQQRSITPELEVFELGMIDYSHYLIRKQILKPPYYYNLLLGSLGSMQATPLNLAMLVNALPSNATWAATGLGRYQFYINSLAIAMGGHVRVGLEDSIYMDTEQTDLATNVRFVERLVNVGRSIGREPATPAEARQIIGLAAHV